MYRSFARVMYRTPSSIPPTTGFTLIAGAAENPDISLEFVAFKPFLFGFLHAFLRRFQHFFLDGIHHWIWILPRRQHHLQFVPQPLAPGQKIKVVAFDGETIGEGHARPVGWPESVQLPVSSSTVRNGPISTTSPVTPLISTQSPKADAVFPHEHEPAQEADDEILQRHGKAGAGEPQNVPS